MMELLLKEIRAGEEKDAQMMADRRSWREKIDASHKQTVAELKPEADRKASREEVEPKKRHGDDCLPRDGGTSRRGEADLTGQET